MAFSAPGGLPISIAEVCQHHCDEQAVEDEQLPLHARDALSEEVTTYRKGSLVHTASSNQAIARKARARGYVLPPRPPTPHWPLPELPVHSD